MKTSTSLVTRHEEARAILVTLKNSVDKKLKFNQACTYAFAHYASTSSVTRPEVTHAI